MREEDFRRKYEPLLHLIPSLTAWIGAAFLVSVGYMNDAGSDCWIAAAPKNCLYDPDIECTRG